jgi:glycosyltransferase involved in cell wall biosynthesis
MKLFYVKYVFVNYTLTLLIILYYLEFLSFFIANLQNDQQGLGETFGRVTIEAMAFGLPVCHLCNIFLPIIVETKLTDFTISENNLVIFFLEELYVAFN